MELNIIIIILGKPTILVGKGKKRKKKSVTHLRKYHTMITQQ